MGRMQRRTRTKDLALTGNEAALLQQLVDVDPRDEVPLGLAAEAWLAVFQPLLRRGLVGVYRGSSAGITERGRYALSLVRRRRQLPAYYVVRVCSSKLRCTDLLRAVAELRARVCPTRRAKRGSVQARWGTGSMQLVLDRRRLEGCYREAWYWVHPDLLERVRTELPAPPDLVSVVAAAWSPPAATAPHPDDTPREA